MANADFPTNLNLSSNSTIGDMYALPNSTTPFFWAWILFALFVIFTLGMYNNERKTKGSGNILSCMAISSLIIIVIATLGSIIGFITLEVLVYSIVIGLLLIAVWFFSK